MTDYEERQKRRFEDLCMTRDEMNTIKDAFKKEEFQKMFADYVKEVTDPENKATFEKEVKELERERGVDVTFVHPKPGYVIKTSVNGTEKAFINICHNELVDKPAGKPGSENSKGLNWSVPYLQGPPRKYFDKGIKCCVVYDVVFHPDTLHLGSQHPEFRKLVNNIALSAVEDNFKVTLDRRNIKFPKLQYKGTKEATVVRRKLQGNVESDSEQTDSPMDLPNYPYPKLVRDPKPNLVKHVSKSVENYTTPKYLLKQRKGMELEEFTYELDSKVYAATPSELVITIELPLIKSASDVTLDVYERSLSLISEVSAKYKLDIKLPWAVDEDSGSAKFDKTAKTLEVTLPVIKKKFQMPMFIREDSGIESDPSQSVKSSSEEDISEKVVELPQKSFPPDDMNENVDEGYRTSQECLVEEQFINPNYHYMFPSFAVNLIDDKLAVVFKVKNVDIDSVKHVFLDENTSVHITFTTVGSGFFPLHYAFYLKLSNSSLDPQVFYHDNSIDNLVLRLKVNITGQLEEYFTGLNAETLEKQLFAESLEDEDDIPNNEHMIAVVNEVIAIEKGDESISVVLAELKLEHEKSEDVNRATSQNENVESFTDAVSKQVGFKCSANRGKLKKSRTLSECGSRDSPIVVRRRSILKCSRSLSESNADDYSAWSSVDSSDSCIPQELTNPCKKTVTFSDIVSEKVFRANSSILGQRKKNQRKARNKKRAQERRASESAEEASGSEMEVFDSSGCEESSVSETSEASSEEETTEKAVVLPSSKTHRRRGSKNKRKNANTAKHNTIFSNDE